MPQTLVTLAELQKSAITYQKQLLQVPVLAAEDTLKYMRPYPGILGRHVITELSGSFQIAPYSRQNWGDGEATLTPRVLETYLGNNAYNFDPNELYGTVFGEAVFKGEELKSTRIAADLLTYVSKQIGRSLNMCLWSAKRNPAGKTTADLFDGWDTITEADITSGNVSAQKGNLVELAEDITADNAVDVFQAVYDSLSDELQGQQVNIYLPIDLYRKYLKCYKAETGAVAYNTQYEQLTLEGSQGLARFVPLASKKGSKYIHIAPQSVMCYGFGNGVPGEGVTVEKYKPWEFTLEAAYAFGVQFATVSPEMFCAVKLKQAAEGGGTEGGKTNP